MRRAISLSTVTLLSVAACRTGPAEPEPMQKDTPTTTTTTTTTATASQGTRPTTPPPVPTPPQDVQVPISPDDPLKGQWTLADATKDLKGTGALVAKIDTSKGALQCLLLADKAPITVANFIGLATGKRTWKDPTGKWVNKPAYDGTTFHRIIKGFMIQGGDAKGNGSGEPGYVIKDELWQGAKHDRAGLLCMANRGPNTNGAQFFITDAAAPHLDRSYTIFGECAPIETIHDIAGVQVMGERPATDVKIKTITISRDEKKK